MNKERVKKSREVVKKKRKEATKRSSKKEHKGNALALGAEEGRDKLRKVTGRSKYPLIRECPNGGTHMRRAHVS